MITQGRSFERPLHNASRTQHLTDEALDRRLSELLNDDNALEADLLAHICEVDRRKLYRGRGYSSMFTFCVEKLHLAEAVAYKRIAVARAAGKYPDIFDRIAQGNIHITAVALLAPHLTPSNVSDLLQAATHKSKREVERLLAARFPKPDAPSRIRKLPRPAAAVAAPNVSLATAKPTANARAPEARARILPKSSPMAASQADARAQVAPLSLDRFKVQFTAEVGLTSKMREAQDLLGPQVAQDDLAELFLRGMDALLRELKNRKHGVTKRPRLQLEPEKKATPTPPSASRTISRAVRRQVFERDAGQCVFVSDDGTRCAERWGLEHHHRQAYALGGQATVQNIELRCRSHNALAAELDFGAEKMGRHVEGAGGRRGGSSCREARAGYHVETWPLVLGARLDPGRVFYTGVG